MASLADLLDYDQRKKQMLQGLVDYASNQYKLGSAFGEGLSDQAKGLAQMVMHPINTATQMYQGGKAVVQNPKAALQAAKEGLTEAVSSPENIAKFAGQNFSPTDLANALNKVGTMRELTVYHGTPHKFEPTPNNPLGEFTASKIGTGEGAAAFGHGIYVAENPAVAKDYQNRLADYGSPYTYKWQGKDYVQGTQGDPVTHAIGLTYHQNSATAKKIARQGIADAKAGEPYALEMGGIDYYQKMLDTANNLKKSDIKVTQGSLYTADLPDEHIEKMLDLDKPWEKQSQYVKDRLKDSGIYAKYKDNLSDFRSPMETRNKTMRGENIHAFIQHLVNNDPAQASQMLKDMGIPGLKYLDEKSRSSGKGTRNFVVFPGEEQNLKILKRE